MTILPDTLIQPEKVIAGRGRRSMLMEECRRFGRRGVLIYGRSLVQSGFLEDTTGRFGDDLSLLKCEHAGGEPTLVQLETLLKSARDHGADWIAAVGGGSVMDLGKACAGLYRATDRVKAYHDGLPIESHGLHFIAAPTTAGTGSEANKVSVLTNTETTVKKSFRSDSMLARTVILDPDFLSRCPRAVIAHSGMDALVQAIESYISRGAVWYTEALALKGIELISGALETVYNHASDPKAEDLLIGSYLTGVAFSASRLGVIHGLAHPLGTRYNLPHGLACAIALPWSLQFNRDTVPEKYARMSDTVGRDLLEFVEDLLAGLGIENPLSGREIIDREGLMAEVMASGSTAHNPRAVTEADVDEALGWLVRS